jgi:hypothetical protein
MDEYEAVRSFFLDGKARSAGCALLRLAGRWEAGEGDGPVSLSSGLSSMLGSSALGRTGRGISRTGADDRDEDGLLAICFES